MGMLLAFAPFLAFAVVDRLMGSTPGLIAGAAIAAALLIRGRLAGEREPKWLEVGTAILFATLAVVSIAVGAHWPVIGVRLCVDAGLLLIVLASLAVGRPFTLQYARERVPAELWASRPFLQTNYVITAAWAAAFGVMVVAEFAMLYWPALPPRAGIFVIVAALVGAFKFTGWYPERMSRLQKGADFQRAA